MTFLMMGFDVMIQGFLIDPSETVTHFIFIYFHVENGMQEQ